MIVNATEIRIKLNKNGDAVEKVWFTSGKPSTDGWKEIESLKAWERHETQVKPIGMIFMRGDCIIIDGVPYCW